MSRVPRLLTLTMACASFGCGRDSDSDSSGESLYASSDHLQQVANREIVFRVPELCPEGVDPHQCVAWIGMNDGKLGLSDVHNRIAFSLEDVDERGSFQLAVFPDCNRDARLAAHAAATIPTAAPAAADGKAPAYEGTISEEPQDTEFRADRDVAKPDAADNSLAAPVTMLMTSPFAECKQLVVGAGVDQPVQLVAPAEVGERGRWLLHHKEGERPVFVSNDPCSSSESEACPMRLLLGSDNIIRTVSAKDSGLGLLNFWRSISGAVNDTFSPVINTVQDATKIVNTVQKVAALGGRDLLVKAATPAARIYDAANDAGLIDYANGAYRDRAIYARIGAQYAGQYARVAGDQAEIVGNATLDGLTAVGEWIEANACVIGITAGLNTAISRESLYWEPFLYGLITAFAEELATSAAFDLAMSNKKSPVYIMVDGAATGIGYAVSLFSKKYDHKMWRNIMVDILGAALAGNVRSGLVGLILSKVAEVICTGLDKAASPRHSVESTISVVGMSDSCLDGLKKNALYREDKGQELCGAMRDEIRMAAEKSKGAATTDDKAPNQRRNAFEPTAKGSSCPQDPNDKTYGNMLAGIGCQAYDVYAKSEQQVAPATVLSPESGWRGGGGDWFGTLTCPPGKVAIGMCSSGKNVDCRGNTKELLCASRPELSVVTGQVSFKARKDHNKDLMACPTGYAVTDLCTSGDRLDCNGNSQTATCAKISDAFDIDYRNCVYKEGKTWDARLQATMPNEVMVGFCESALHQNCGRDGQATKAAMFCPLRLNTDDVKGTHPVFRVYNGWDHMMIRDLGENAAGFVYETALLRLFTNPGEGRAPLYRCRDAAGNHFDSPRSDCEGNVHEGLLGYMSTTDTGKPIHRCAGNGDHFLTLDRNECNGVNFEATLGFSL